MYLTKYIERMGTGIRDIIRRCVDAGLPEPEIRIDGGFFVLTVRRKKAESVDQAEVQVAGQVTPQVTPQVRALLGALVDSPRSREELQDAVEIKDREHFRKAYLEPLLAIVWIERTIPDKPTSRLQKYRLTEKGRVLLDHLDEKGVRS
jgi:ATP-dependent DNA helicase RecG